MTIIFYIILLIFRKRYLFILQLILILSYIGQQSVYVYKRFYLEFPKYHKYSLEYSFECIPFTITGFTLGYYKVIDNIQKNKIKILILSIIIYNVTADYNIFTKIKGLGYQGIKYNIQSIFCQFHQKF